MKFKKIRRINQRYKCIYDALSVLVPRNFLVFYQTNKQLFEKKIVQLILSTIVEWF